MIIFSRALPTGLARLPGYPPPWPNQVACLCAALSHRFGRDSGHSPRSRHTCRRRGLACCTLRCLRIWPGTRHRHDRATFAVREAIAYTTLGSLPRRPLRKLSSRSTGEETVVVAALRSSFFLLRLPPPHAWCEALFLSEKL